MDDISMEEVTTAQCGAGNACRCSLLGSECRDFSKEFILPDYVPDIKKIVSVTVTPKTEKLDAEGFASTFHALVVRAAPARIFCTVRKHEADFFAFLPAVRSKAEHHREHAKDKKESYDAQKPPSPGRNQTEQILHDAAP